MTRYFVRPSGTQHPHQSDEMKKPKGSTEVMVKPDHGGQVWNKAAGQWGPVPTPAARDRVDAAKLFDILKAKGVIDDDDVQ